MGQLCIAVAFNAVAKKNDGLLRVLSEEMMKYDINNPLRICHFLAQLSHESNGFTRMRENFNYTPSGILSTFNTRHITRFTSEQANLYGRTTTHKANQEMIANIGYANRMGNGSASSGDGWAYRGWGWIQLTGFNNHKKHGIIPLPSKDKEIQKACEVACKFWVDAGCNVLADKDDLDGISDVINIGRHTDKIGDANGYLERKELLLKAKKSVGIQ